MREYSPFESTPEERVYGNPSLYQEKAATKDPTFFGASYDSKTAELGARMEQDLNLGEGFQPASDQANGASYSTGD